MRLGLPLALSLLIFSTLAFAGFPAITAKNLSLDLKNNSGVGFVNFLKYNINNISLTHTALQAQVKKYPDRLIVSDTETQIEFNYPLYFLDNFSAIDVHEVNLVSVNESFNLTMEKSLVNVSGMSYELLSLLLSCQGSPGIKHAFDSCTEKSAFNVDKFSFEEKSAFSNVFTAIAESALSPMPNKKKKWNPFRVRYIHDLKLAVQKSKLTGEVKIKSIINIPFKMEGTVAYNEKNDEFKIELTKAKAFIFDVRKSIFKELAKLNIKELKVEPPFIYIKLRGAR